MSYWALLSERWGLTGHEPAFTAPSTSGIFRQDPNARARAIDPTSFKFHHFTINLIHLYINSQRTSKSWRIPPRSRRKLLRHQSASSKPTSSVTESYQRRLSRRLPKQTLSQSKIVLRMLLKMVNALSAHVITTHQHH